MINLSVFSHARIVYTCMCVLLSHVYKLCGSCLNTPAVVTRQIYTPVCHTKVDACNYIAACPQVFSSGGTCTLLPSFLGVHPNFWGCNVSSNSSFGGTKKINCIFSTQGHAPCCFFVNVTQSWRKLSFSV